MKQLAFLGILVEISKLNAEEGSNVIGNQESTFLQLQLITNGRKGAGQYEGVVCMDEDYCVSEAAARARFCFCA